MPEILSRLPSFVHAAPFPGEVTPAHSLVDIRTALETRGYPVEEEETGLAGVVGIDTTGKINGYPGAPTHVNHWDVNGRLVRQDYIGNAGGTGFAGTIVGFRYDEQGRLTRKAATHQYHDGRADDTAYIFEYVYPADRPDGEYTIRSTDCDGQVTVTTHEELVGKAEASRADENDLG